MNLRNSLTSRSLDTGIRPDGGQLKTVDHENPYWDQQGHCLTIHNPSPLSLCSAFPLPPYKNLCPHWHINMGFWALLVWFSGLSTSLWIKGSLVGLLVRAHAWVGGWVPRMGCIRGNQTLMFLYFFLPPFPSKSKKKNKTYKKDGLLRTWVLYFLRWPAFA